MCVLCERAESVTVCLSTRENTFCDCFSLTRAHKALLYQISKSEEAKMDTDKLIEIPPHDWIELRDLFLLNWPDNHVAWHSINNYVNWYRKQSYIRHLKIYSLNNSWRSDGTYVVVVRTKKLIKNFSQKRICRRTDINC